MERKVAFWLVLVVGAVAVWESWESFRPLVVRDSDVRAVSQLVRASYEPGTLIEVTPDWASPLFRRELGEFMPADHLGRADSKPFARITEIAFGKNRTLEFLGFPSDALVEERRIGPWFLRRYRQTPVLVTFDLTEHLLDATVSQTAEGLSESEWPCVWSGPLPSVVPKPGPLGGFVCEQTRVERRTMEIDYKPRRGMVVELKTKQRTRVRFSIPDAAWRGSTLHLWLGLHDFHQRKQARGPARVLVDLDDGQQTREFQVDPTQGFELQTIPLPTTNSEVHHLRMEFFAEHPPHHFVGVHGELRR